MIGWIVLAVIVLVALWAVAIFNKLVKNRNLVQEGWSGIDVQLKRRYNLIPNLVETVKGYAGHEKETLEKVVELRNSASRAQTAEEKAPIENMLTQTLKSLFAVAENYPKLQAVENFKLLQEELAGTENKIAYIRTAYNDSVLEYDNALEMFPSNIIAGIFGFKPRQYFEAPEAEKKAPKVKF